MKKRKNSYFGLHFDFHANESTKDIGGAFDERVLDEILSKIKPDFVQCDTKGHPGISSYPTKVGFASAAIKTDILKKWRDITKKHGVALYAHFSGVWDAKQSKLHPNWCTVNPDGTINYEKMSVFGEYAEASLIPQLIEIVTDYGLNGAWVDGECWAVPVDYHPNAVKLYKTQYGKAPAKPNEDGYDDYKAFNRQKFLEYVERYIKAVKKIAPNFEITSNWLNTAQVPDDIHITDYISGDLDPNNCVDSALFDGRLIQNYNRSWDLMAWGFRYPVHYLKLPTVLCQEAAAVVALGGGFQLYNFQDAKTVVRDASEVDAWAELATFARQREAFCHQAKPIHDVAVIHSNQAFYHKKDSLFGRWGNDYTYDLNGLFNLFNSCQYSTEVLLGFNAVKKDLSTFAMLAVSNLETIEPQLKEKLLNYASNGGVLIITGADTIKVFSQELGITDYKKVTYNATMQIMTDGKNKIVSRQPYAEISLDSMTTVIETMLQGEVTGGDINDQTQNPPPQIDFSKSVPSMIKRNIGKGILIGVPFNIGKQFFDARCAQLTTFADKMTADYQDKKIKVTGSAYAYPILMQKDGKEYIHLLNTAGEHRAEKVASYNEIPPLYNLTIQYKSPNKPVKMTLLPENKPLNFTHNNGIIQLEIDKLTIHSAIEVALDQTGTESIKDTALDNLTI